MISGFPKPGDGHLSRWFQPEHFTYTKAYIDAERWAKDFVADNMACTADAATLALDYAKNWYAQADKRRKAIDAKLLEHLKGAATLLAAEFVIVKFSDGKPGWLLVLSAWAAVAAMVLALIGRLSFFKPWPPSIRATFEGLVHEGLKDERQRKLWLAANYYPVCVANEGVIDHIAVYERRAAAAIVTAGALLAMALLAMAIA